jgi:hypothetical protein
MTGRHHGPRSVQNPPQPPFRKGGGKRKALATPKSGGSTGAFLPLQKVGAQPERPCHHPPFLKGVWTGDIGAGGFGH